MKATCPVCKNLFPRNYPGRVTCSRSCSKAHLGTYEERFWKRVKKSSKCWEWQGRLEESGYARIKRQGQRTQIFVHRLAWELVNGLIPDGLDILHTCDNRKCVRPTHLFLGTATDNMQDMLRKGRANKARGERHGNVKLSEQDIRAIRERASSGEPQMKLAIEYDVHFMTINKIVRRQRWAHVA
jgi:HNH endonuclease